MSTYAHESAFFRNLRESGDMAGAIVEFSRRLQALPDYVPGSAVFDAGGTKVAHWDGRHVGHLVIADGLTLNAAPWWSMPAIGDAILWSRYLPEARQRCHRLTLCLHRSLHDLFRRVVGTDDVVEREELARVVSDADAYSLMRFDLAHALGVVRAAPLKFTPLPHLVPELDPAMLHVGVCAVGSANPALACPITGADLRSVPIEDLGNILRQVDGVTLHSLQLEPVPDYVTRHDLRDWDATVGVIAACDVVVTIDTAVAHLAASMGRPTMVVLNRFPAWQWGTGERSHHYPAAHIFRGDVGGSLQRISAALELRAAAKRAGRIG